MQPEIIFNVEQEEMTIVKVKFPVIFTVYIYPIIQTLMWFLINGVINSSTNYCTAILNLYNSKNEGNIRLEKNLE